MDVFYSYSYATAGWMLIQAVPLMATPTVITAMLSPEVREATPLEVYLSRTLGITMIAVGFLVVLLTGSVPLSSKIHQDSGDAAATSTDPSDPKAPYALPALYISLVYHVITAFHAYGQFNNTGSYGYMFACLVGGTFSAVAMWCVLFASSDGRISRKTGADKRTSGFPFKNNQAASAQKKEWKKGQ